jgi:translocator protein
MDRDVLRQVAVVVGFVVTVAVNYLAEALPLNGMTTGEISAQFPVLCTPAPYVFAIWGLIYVLLGAYTLYQALPARRGDARLRAVGWLFVAASLCNVAWVFAWHYGRIAVTQLAMVGLLACVMAIYSRLDIALAAVTRAERWAVQLPFSVYLGWITVATVANGAVTLVDAGWNGGTVGPVPWTLAILVVAALLALAVAFTRRDGVYPLVLVWAYVGIWVARRGDSSLLAMTALGLAAVLAVVAVWTLWRGRAALAVAHT